MNFTENQQNAIDVRDCSLIVSAGAGSGKTAVLTERILERICDENDDCNIDDFLIVTFTNAAAKELSDRIRKKLSERAAKQPLNKKIINNIALLPLAKISTINSFCYELVRNNFQKLGLGASVRIADESEMAVVRQRVVNDLINDYFENDGDDEVFLAVYEIFSSAKNDNGFVEAILDLDRKLRCLPDPDGFCKNILDGYREVSETDEFFDTQIGKALREKVKKQAENAASVFEKLCNECAKYPQLADKYLPSVECELNLAKSVLYSLDKGYCEVKKSVDNAEKVSFKAIRNFENPSLQNLIKDTKASVSSDFRQMLAKNFGCSKELLETCAEDTYLVLSKLFEITNEFSSRLEEKKKQMSVIEFSDAERYALSLLVKSMSPFSVTPLALQLRERFTEVYIDEYQDVNPLQDMIFKAVSRTSADGNEYSRFMVGDIKQSIYRFRGASSEIFMNYRDSFCDVDAKGLQKRIFMNDNFRCCESVIEFTNCLFSRLMKEYYLEGDKLLHSRLEAVRLMHKVKYIAFDYDKETADGISSSELEAAIICKEIKRIVENPEITDADGKMYSYSDVAILARSKPALKVYESVLGMSGIPTASDVGESFYGKKEILLCLNILNSIDNPERDIYLAGFMRSFAGAFSDDELAIIRKLFRDMSLYRAVINYSENGDDEALREKCRVFVEKLREYRQYSRGKSAEKLLWKLYCDMDILAMCSSDRFTCDKKGTRKNLFKLYQMARDFSSTSFKGVGAFIEYVNGSMNESDIKSERDMGKDCVRLMTVHASKGLEFPICFVSDLSRKFNRSDETARLVFSEKSGVAVTLCDTAAIKSAQSDTGMIKIDTPYRGFVTDEIDSELIEEEIRILYVAMTRARDMLILTGGFSKKIENTMKDALVTKYTESYSCCTSFASLILGAMAHEQALSPFFDAAGIERESTENAVGNFFECVLYGCENAADDYKNLIGTAANDDASEDDTEIDAELLALLKKRSELVIKTDNTPSKLTVSQLKKGLIDEEKAVLDSDEQEEDTLPCFMADELSVDAAEKGTAMHMFMQFARYENCEMSCESEADRLCTEGFIDERQRSILDIRKLDEFFSSSFYKTIKQSNCMYREQRFNLSVDAFDVSLPGEILVQGVIDLFYENDDGTYTVVDFKTDRVFGDGAEEILIERHKEQLMYYKKAVEEMTERKVKNTYIYSFSLMKQIAVE